MRRPAHLQSATKHEGEIPAGAPRSTCLLSRCRSDAPRLEDQDGNRVVEEFGSIFLYLGFLFFILSTLVALPLGSNHDSSSC